MEDKRKREIERVDFLSDQVMALKEAIHADIILKPGDNGPGIPTHKAVLAVKSKVFRNMLDSDECKVSPEKSITIPDLSYEELQSFIEFFYCGILSHDNKHIRALYLAADKYDIQYLQDICRQILIASLNSENVLDILQLATIPSDAILKEAVIAFTTTNLRVIFSNSFKLFAHNNPSLSLEITQACIRRLFMCCQKQCLPPK